MNTRRLRLVRPKWTMGTMLIELAYFLLWSIAIAAYFVLAWSRYKRNTTRLRFAIYIVLPAIGFFIWAVGYLWQFMD